MVYILSNAATQHSHLAGLDDGTATDGQVKLSIQVVVEEVTSQWISSYGGIVW